MAGAYELGRHADGSYQEPVDAPISYMVDTEEYVLENHIPSSAYPGHRAQELEGDDYWDYQNQKTLEDIEKREGENDEFIEQNLRRSEALQYINSQSLQERYQDLYNALVTPSVNMDTINRYIDAYNISRNCSYEELLNAALNSASYDFLLRAEKEYVALEVSQILRANKYDLDLIDPNNIVLHHEGGRDGEKSSNTFSILTSGESQFYNGTSFRLSKQGGNLLEDIISVSEPGDNKKTITPDQLSEALSDMSNTFEKGTFFIDTESFYLRAEQQGVHLHADPSVVKHLPSKNKDSSDDMDR